MKPKICAPIVARDLHEAIKLVKKAEELKADLLELRYDFLAEDIDIAKFLSATTLPVILTIRKQDEGGRFTGGENERIQKILNNAEKGFRYVDIELSTSNLKSIVSELKMKGLQVIVSKHIFDGTPEPHEIAKLIEEEARSGADICKLIVTAKSLEDNLICLNLLRKISRKYRVVHFAMGKYGVISRVLSPVFGSEFTYAAVEKGKESAEGQITIEELLRIYGILGIR